MGPRQKLRTYLCPHFAARPFCLCFTNIELEIVQGSFGQHVFEFQLFNRQLCYPELAFRIHAADQFTRRAVRRRSAEQRGQKSL